MVQTINASEGLSLESGKWLVGIIIALMELICSVALVFATIALSNSANQIANLQTSIAKGSQTPEFAYLGPEQQSTAPADGYLIPVSSENNYGMRPRFAKTSGFANDMTASAYMYYELVITHSADSSESNAGDPSKEKRIIPLEVHGTSHSSLVFLDEGVAVVQITESGSEDLNFKTLATALEAEGYHLSFVYAYFVETISYTDVVGDSCEKAYYIKHPSKNQVTPGSLFERAAGDPIVVTLDRSQPNLGLSLDFPSNFAAKCIARFEETMP